MIGRRLPAAFFERNALEVAADLPGKIFVRDTSGCRLAGRIVEVEAYTQHDDPASHSYRGRTGRNEVMFGPGGHLYVYLIYGMHFCMNFVTGKSGEGDAVLLRAMEPVSGTDMMRKNRGSAYEKNLLNGPARCAQAFGVTLAQNGSSLLAGEFGVYEAPASGSFDVMTSPRIGITKAKDLLRRFYIAGSPHVSGKT